MSIGVVVFPGSNCEHDVVLALKGQGVPMREVARDVQRVLVSRQ